MNYIKNEKLNPDAIRTTFRLNPLDWIAFILLVIGGLNLGIIGLLNYDPLLDMLSSWLIFAHIFLFFIGLAAIYAVIRVALIIRALQPHI